MCDLTFSILWSEVQNWIACKRKRSQIFHVQQELSLVVIDWLVFYFFFFFFTFLQRETLESVGKWMLAEWGSLHIEIAS